MSLARLVRGATVGLALLACEASSEPVAQGCKTDMECKDNRYCVNGQCQGNGVSRNGQTEYTCESGAQMFVDLCCPKFGGCNKTYQELLNGCKEGDNTRADLSVIYGCVYNVCSESGSIDGCKLSECFGDSPTPDCR